MFTSGTRLYDNIPHMRRRMEKKKKTDGVHFMHNACMRTAGTHTAFSHMSDSHHELQ